MDECSPGTASDSPRRSWSFAALLAGLAMLGTFSVDMYLPAFPAMGRELAAPPLALQQTLSVYLFAYAFMMLWHGALSDAYGRRPIVLGGLLVYAVGTLGCAIAGNIESLWLFRAVQGVSAGTGLVVARAIIRDRFHGPEAQRLMSQITMVFGVAPALAPRVGGGLLNTLGWRSIFWILLIVVFSLFVWANRSLPGALPVAARQTLQPAATWRNYQGVLTHSDFLLLTMIPALNFAAFFIYIAAAPAFLIGGLLGVTTWGFAWLFVPMISGVMIGSGTIMPSVTLLLLELFPTMRGLASSLQGFVQFALAAFNAGTIAPLLATSLMTLAGGMAAFATASLVCWLIYQRNARTQLKGWNP